MGAQSLETRALRMLVQRIEEEAGRRLHNLRGAGDWADHCKRVGFLEGLDFAKNICADVESDLYKG